ncbi:(2Fe-2S)-binding protein [Saccharopolyspora sp. 7B]|uniref:(2Fe-2S)-binding protein n=1 Tax=Saccharopolyspora sp. 7B TaxID=2877240 RepID=UPI0035B3A6FA
MALAAEAGSGLPPPRYVDVRRPPPGTGTARFVRRASCCLAFRLLEKGKCATCPRRSPVDRAAFLRDRAALL